MEELSHWKKLTKKDGKTPGNKSKPIKSKRMKSIYKGTAIIAILFIVVCCCFSKKQAANRMVTNDLPQLEIVVLDPGHFHASLLQKEKLTDVSDTIRIYAPEGTGVNQYLESIDY